MKKSLIKSLLLALVTFLLSGCTSKQMPPIEDSTSYNHSVKTREIATTVVRQKAKRVLRNHQFDNIGFIQKDGKSYCSGTILKHGIFLTAKHCFSGRQFGGEGLKHFSLAFITKNSSPENPYLVPYDSLVRIFPDEGFNDIAYILYKPEATQSIPLSVRASDFLNFEEELTSLMLVGFPKVISPIPQKISSEQCSLAEISGRYRKYPKSLFYKGEFFDTTCPAYSGNSGGPALGVKMVQTENGFSAKVEVVGVVAHTFNDENAIQKDEFGDFVDNANISPLRDAKNLNTILNLDIQNLNDATFLGNKILTLNTPELNVSDWLIQQKYFPLLFYPAESFWKKPQDLQSISKKRQELQNSYGNFQAKCPLETNRVQNIFNNIVLKNNLSKYLEGNNSLLIFVNCENSSLDAGAWHGSLQISKGMINTLKTDGALSCLVAHELSHHLLKHDQIDRNEIFISKKELDADSLGTALSIQAGFTKADCESYLRYTVMLDAAIAGSEDPYPTSYERMQNLKDLVIKK